MKMRLGLSLIGRRVCGGATAEDVVVSFIVFDVAFIEGGQQDVVESLSRLMLILDCFI